MTLRFYVQYSSAWGEQLFFSYTCGNVAEVLPMAYLDAHTWWLELTVDSPATLHYHYLLNGLAEKNVKRIVPGNNASLTIRDEWLHPGAMENVWLAAPFHLPQQESRTAAPTGEARLDGGHHCVFKVRSPLSREPLWLTGNIPALGNWDETKAVPLHYVGDGYFGASLQIPAGSHVEYKYFRAGRYEAGANRTVITGAHTLVQDGFTRFDDQLPKAAGVAVPVFSLRSERSCGVGEFADIRLLADWAEQTGLRMIQLLPVNDTTVNHTWTDSYPYAVISAFALHPVYVNLPAVGMLDNMAYGATQTRLNTASLLDYEAVMQYKTRCLRLLYAQHSPDEAFHTWVSHNEYWLQPYAAFCCGRDNESDGGFYYFVQYHLHLQLSEAVAYARSKGVAVKGDLPIGVSLQSADVAAFPALFHTGLQAGAPPDEFAEKGQNWGFPTYNWSAMEVEGYAWWKQRLQHMSQYFSAYRIDHILGFFRIWQIPRHAKDGILGYFEPAIPLTKDELQQWGIPFSRERYCNPYITDGVLYRLFGAQAVTVRAVCLEPSGGGHYRLLEGFRTQAEVMDAGLEPSITEGLLNLITNVLLIEPSPGCYHPRFHLHRTSSFEALDEDVQQRLQHLAAHFFYSRHHALWEQEALRKLPVLQQATDMLVCGEDLGMVPHGVPGVMRQLGILSLEAQYMPKHPGHGPADAPYFSVITPSTHDMPTLREWRPANGRQVLEAQLQSPAMWCIPLLQDWLSLDTSLPLLPPDQERINNPAVMPWYWRYRMPLTLEALLRAGKLNRLMSALIKESGR